MLPGEPVLDKDGNEQFVTAFGRNYPVRKLDNGEEVPVHPLTGEVLEQAPPKEEAPEKGPSVH